MKVLGNIYMLKPMRSDIESYRAPWLSKSKQSEMNVKKEIKYQIGSQMSRSYGSSEAIADRKSFVVYSERVPVWGQNWSGPGTWRAIRAEREKREDFQYTNLPFYPLSVTPFWEIMLNQTLLHIVLCSEYLRMMALLWFLPCLWI